jgi:hypothetical protein
MTTVETDHPAAEELKFDLERRPSADAWKARGTYLCAMHSGVEVTIRYPDLQLLLLNDAIPERLQAIALKQVYGEDDDLLSVPEVADKPPLAKPEDEAEKLRRQLEETKQMSALLDQLIVEMVVEPKLRIEDVPQLPPEDRALLIAIAQREQTVDALGRSLGVAPIQRLDRFRRLHDCAPGCPACETLRLELSSGFGG